MHFIGLVNVVNLKAGGLGTLGAEQLEWLENDVKRLRAARQSWCSRTSRCGRFIRNGAGGPTTARRRSRYLKRFGSVTVLNGHIHQVMQKVEGQHHVSYGDVDGVSAARARAPPFAWADEGGGRSTEEGAGELRRWTMCADTIRLAVVDSTLA